MKAGGLHADATSSDIDEPRRHQTVDRTSGEHRGNDPQQGSAGADEDECDESGPDGGYGGTGPDQQHPNRKVRKA